MAINSLNTSITKPGSNFEQIYGTQNSTQQITVPNNNYANPYTTNFNFRDGQLLARLSQFDTNII